MVYDKEAAGVTSTEAKSEVYQQPVSSNIVSPAVVDIDLESTKETEKDNEKTIKYLHGLDLYLVTLAIWIIIFLVNMEASIVSTALIAISNQLKGFDDSSWIVSGYQISYTGFLVIWAKMSDIFGRKSSLIAAIFFFIVFTAACGAAQSMTQLIIFRVLQGSGASGAFSVTMVIVYEMVPKPRLPLYTGICFIVVALATTSGPLIGGAVVTKGSWRWIFLLNIPPTILAIVLLLIYFPAQYGSRKNSEQKETVLALLKKIDFVGAILLLAASFLLVTALLEASTEFHWASAVIIALIVLSAISWVSFILWEWFLGKRGSKQEEMFPWRFVKNRPWMAMLLISFLVGIPNNVIVVSMPQRFQIVDSASPLKAGIHLLPYTIASPFGLLIGNAVGGATKISPIYLMLGSSLVGLLGIGLLNMIPIDGGMLGGIYVFEIITALGIGVTAALTMLATPHCIEAKDLAVGTSSMVQARMMGSAIGLAIAMSVVNSYLSSSLGSALPQSQISDLLQNLELLSTYDSIVQVQVRHVFGRAFRLETWIITGIASAQVLAVGLMWKKKQISFHTHKE